MYSLMFLMGYVVVWSRPTGSMLEDCTADARLSFDVLVLLGVRVGVLRFIGIPVHVTQSSVSSLSCLALLFSHGFLPWRINHLLSLYNEAASEESGGSPYSCCILRCCTCRKKWKMSGSRRRPGTSSKERRGSERL